MSEVGSAVGTNGAGAPVATAPQLMTFGASDAGVCVDGVCAVPGADGAAPSPASPSPGLLVAPTLI